MVWIADLRVLMFSFILLQCLKLGASLPNLSQESLTFSTSSASPASSLTSCTVSCCWTRIIYFSCTDCISIRAAKVLWRVDASVKWRKSLQVWIAGGWRMVSSLRDCKSLAMWIVDWRIDRKNLFLSAEEPSLWCMSVLSELSEQAGKICSSKIGEMIARPHL